MGTFLLVFVPYLRFGSKLSHRESWKTSGSLRFGFTFGLTVGFLCIVFFDFGFALFFGLTLDFGFALFFGLTLGFGFAVFFGFGCFTFGLDEVTFGSGFGAGGSGAGMGSTSGSGAGGAGGNLIGSPTMG
ncbi:MAG: hypothetical protein IJC21_01835, partial [Lentisphaeria bacterium]|nr:hypothetical protein [Lentisphaeria bacterium]